MTERSPLMVFVLSVVTLGLYEIYWLVKTKDEMNAAGAEVPTAWLILVPIVSLWWMWKYSEGVDTVTRGQTSAAISLLLLLLLGPIGVAVLQSGFNRRALAAAPA